MVHPKEQPGFGILFCFKLQIYNSVMISESTYVLRTQISFISERALIFYSLWPCGERIPEISSYTAVPLCDRCERIFWMNLEKKYYFHNLSVFEHSNVDLNEDNKSNIK